MRRPPLSNRFRLHWRCCQAIHSRSLTSPATTPLAVPPCMVTDQCPQCPPLAIHSDQAVIVTGSTSPSCALTAPLATSFLAGRVPLPALLNSMESFCLYLAAGSGGSVIYLGVGSQWYEVCQESRCGTRRDPACTRLVTGTHATQMGIRGCERIAFQRNLEAEVDRFIAVPSSHNLFSPSPGSYRRPRRWRTCKPPADDSLPAGVTPCQPLTHYSLLSAAESLAPCAEQTRFLSHPSSC